MEIWYNWGFLPDDTKVCQTCVYWEGERHREGHNVYCLGQTDGICNNFDWAGYQQLAARSGVGSDISHHCLARSGQHTMAAVFCGFCSIC